MPLSGVFFSFIALNWCNLVVNELNPVQWVNSKEPAFTWLSCCCYGREARQGRKNLPHSHFHSLKPLLSSSTPSFSLCQEAWLAGNPVTNESTQLLLSSLHFSNNSLSLSLTSACRKNSSHSPFICNISHIIFFVSILLFSIRYKNIPSKSNTKSTSKA